MIGPSDAASGEGRFALGKIVATANALNSLPSADVLLALGRHARGDWGDVCTEDWQANERALAEGTRLFSVYHSRHAQRFYVITEADRSITTVLLPEDY